MAHATAIPEVHTAAAQPLPPVTRGLPLVGALPEFLLRPFEFFLAAQKRYGDIYTLDLGVVRWVILNHPRQADYILRENGQNYRKGGGMWEMVRSLVGNGLVVSEGDFWLRQRRMMQPHFHRKQLAGLASAMAATTADCLQSWDRAEAQRRPQDIMSGFSAITMRVIARALFGQGLGDAELSRVSDSMAFVMDYMMTGTLAHSLPKWVPVPGGRRYRKALQDVDALVAQLIATERQRATPSDSLLAMLSRMVDAESGESMTDAQLRDEVKTFFLAGYETTSVALTWTLYLLSQHPAVMDKLRAEVDAALGGRSPEFADLSSLTYCRMVIQEAMRLRPGSWWLPRVAVADDVIDGHAIPAGTTVVSLTWGIHHNPEIWAEPTRFDPERFASEKQSRQTREQKMGWIPFGTGQRQCIGKDFALMEAQIILAMIVQRYHFTLAGGPMRHIAPKFTMTLRPSSPVRMHLERRASPR